MKNNNLRFGLLTAVALSLSGPALALDFQLGGLDGRIDSSFTLGMAFRLEDQDPRLIGLSNTTSDGRQGRAYSTNIDDGNLAFEQGDLISGAAKLTSEMTLARGDWGIYVSANYLYDTLLNDHEFLDEEDFAGPPTRSGDAQDLNRRRSRLQDRLGNDADLLDANIFGGFDIGGEWMTIRLGRQVLNWGESVFVLNGVNSFLSADAAQTRVPGVKLEEVFLPAGMAWISTPINSALSIEAFYQFEWVSSEADPAGSFFSGSDIAGYGAETLELAFGRCPELSNPVVQGGQCAASPGGSAIRRAPDVEPDDGGQGGLALRGFLEDFGGIDWALYAVNYHSRLPLASLQATQAGFEAVAATGRYFLEYPEDIQLFGASFNSLLPVLGGLSFQGEYSFKKDQPLQLDGVEIVLSSLRIPVPTQLGPFEPGEYVRGWRRHDVHQLDFSFGRIAGPGLFGQQESIMLIEFAGTLVDDLPDSGTLAYEAPATDTPANPLTVALLNASAAGTVAATGLPQPATIVANTQPYADDFSWGYRLVGRMTYHNVLGVLQIHPTLYFAHDVSGTTPGPIANFVEDRQELRLAIDAEYQHTFSVQLGYTRYFGAGERNLLQDRDNLALSFEYTF